MGPNITPPNESHLVLKVEVRRLHFLQAFLIAKMIFPSLILNLSCIVVKGKKGRKGNKGIYCLGKKDKTKTALFYLMQLKNSI